MLFALFNDHALSSATRIFRSERRGNVHRDRAGVLAWLHGLDDDMFRRQFRIERIDLHRP